MCGKREKNRNKDGRHQPEPRTKAKPICFRLQWPLSPATNSSARVFLPVTAAVHFCTGCSSGCISPKNLLCAVKRTCIIEPPSASIGHFLWSCLYQHRAVGFGSLIPHRLTRSEKTPHRQRTSIALMVCVCFLDIFPFFLHQTISSSFIHTPTQFPC